MTPPLTPGPDTPASRQATSLYPPPLPSELSALPFPGPDVSPAARPDLPTLRPQLSSSQTSLSGEAEAGAVQVRGSLYFALRYEPGAAQLRVHVIQCQGLAAARRRRSDP